jgi:uncharacterized protein (DUF1330 family)
VEAPTPRAYLIIDVEILDPDGFARYVSGHRASVEEYGGRFLVAGGPFESLEGNYAPRLIVIQEWPSRARFHEWYASAAYAPWKELRHRVARTNVTLVEGVPPAA